MLTKLLYKITDLTQWCRRLATRKHIIYGYLFLQDVDVFSTYPGFAKVYKLNQSLSNPADVKLTPRDVVMNPFFVTGLTKADFCIDSKSN